MLDKQNILLVGTDARSISKLREMLNALPFTNELQTTRSLGETSKLLADGSIRNILVLLHSLGDEAIVGFMSSHRAAVALQSIRVVVALDKHIRNPSSVIAKLYLEGIAGFVAEPFTTDDLGQLIELVVRNDRNEMDEHLTLVKASSFVAADAMRMLDTIALAEVREQTPDRTVKNALAQVSDQLGTLFERDRDAFENALASRFGKAKPFEERVETARKVRKSAQHPGLRVAEIIRARGISEDQIATVMQCGVEELASLLRGEADIDEAKARALSRAVGYSPREWTAWQAEYDRSRHS